jgi:hypothetical protein
MSGASGTRHAPVVRLGETVWGKLGARSLIPECEPLCKAHQAVAWHCQGPQIDPHDPRERSPGLGLDHQLPLLDVTKPSRNAIGCRLVALPSSILPIKERPRVRGGGIFV